MSIKSILELSRLGLALGVRQKRRRELFDAVSREAGRHFVGIVGPRGAGKTILLQQLAAAHRDACYLSLDTLPKDTDLFETVKLLVDRYQYRRFYLDEVHFLEGALGYLKKIYDFLDVHVVFTSSVALKIRESAHDLARRVRLHTLDYFSFREYLAFRHGETLPYLDWDALLQGAWDPEHLRAEVHFSAYLAGGLLPFALDEPEPLPLLEATIETIIHRDIPSTLRLHIDELDNFKRLLRFVGRSEVDGINYSSLAQNLGITKYKAEQYVQALESAFVLQRLLPRGTNVLQEPKILLMPPLRMLYRDDDKARGGLREDFFALAMRQANQKCHYLKTTRGAKTPDFCIIHRGQNLVCEIGGRGKGRSQFKGIQADQKRVLTEGSSCKQGQIPLHLVGFLTPV